MLLKPGPCFQMCFGSGFKFQHILKTHWSKCVQKHIQKQGSHFENMLVPKLWQWIVQ